MSWRNASNITYWLSELVLNAKRADVAYEIILCTNIMCVGSVCVWIKTKSTNTDY